MATAPNTQSTLTLPNGTNKTSTALSTNIIIMVNNTAVGAVQQLSIKENRPLKMIDEVGTDGHVDSVPVSSTNISGTCQRIRFDRLRITEAFTLSSDSFKLRLARILLYWVLLCLYVLAMTFLGANLYFFP